MKKPAPASNRRDFLRTTGTVTATSALAGVTIPKVWAAENNTVQLALVGCGGRGGGAAQNALNVTNLPTKLVAMADVMEHKLRDCHNGLKNAFANAPGKVDVPDERKFLGFDAAKHAMDALKPGDVVILTTPLAFRAPHFKMAIERGLHVFMEKPVTADAPTSKRMLELAKEVAAREEAERTAAGGPASKP